MQRHSRLLVEALARTREVDLTVIHPHPDIKVFSGLKGVKEISLPPLPGKKHYFFELKDYSKLVLAELRNFPDHLVYSQGLSVWAGFHEVADRTIVNPHGLEPFQALGTKARLKTWPYRRALRKMFRKAAKVVSLGGQLTKILEEISPDNVVVLPNATNPLQVPAEELYKQRTAPVRFLFVGRFADNKGIDVLLDAAGMLNDQGFKDLYQLDLIGKGPLFEQIQETYTHTNVTFHGFVEDDELEQAYRDNHIFVLPTLFEGMPTVVLEAMARAMPVIVTDVGATRELVDDRNGKIIRKQDVRDLARTMQQFMEMPRDSFAQLSRNSLDKFLTRFTWDAVARQHIDLFREMWS